MNFRLCGIVLCLYFFYLIEGQDVIITTATEKTPVEMRCVTANTSDTFSWSYENDQIMANGSNIYEVKNSHNTGTYKCFSSAGENTLRAINYTTPYIEHTTKSIYATEGDVNTTLVCHSYSFPDPIMYWLREKDGEKINLSSASSPEYSVKNDGTTSVLTIITMTAQSRANYQCHSENLAGKGNYTILVRVADNLAPLWPFLGIVAEIVVLAIVMLIITRREKGTTEPASPTRSAGSRSSKQD